MFRLIAVDLDGTLLNGSHFITDRTAEVLRELSGRGITIAIATGRSKASVEHYIQQLSLPQPAVPVVCYNGAYGMMYHRKVGSYESATIFANSVPAASCERLISFADRHDLVLQYYNGESGEVYAVPRTEGHLALLRRYELLVGKKQVMLDSYQQATDICEAAKALIMTESADSLLDLAVSQLDLEEFSVIRGSPDPFFVEFLKPNVTKGEGLRLLCEHLGIAMDQVLAFGDGDNDKEMLQMAGMGCAISNAKHAAKAVAHTVIEWTNDEDGVARHLQQLSVQGIL